MGRKRSKKRREVINVMTDDELAAIEEASKTRLVSDEDAVAFWKKHGIDVDVLTKRQQSELDRRLAEHEADPSSALAWKDVRARLWSRVGRN